MCGDVRAGLRTTAVTLLLAFAPGGIHAGEPNDGIVLIDVDASQLNNRGDPTGYAQVILEFRVKNLATGRKYASPDSSERYPSLLRLPAGEYCLYSVSLPFGATLDYCREPFFSVHAGRASNLGRWRFGVFPEDGSYRLMSAFEEQERVAQQAFEHYPDVFGDE